MHASFTLHPPPQRKNQELTSGPETYILLDTSKAKRGWIMSALGRMLSFQVGLSIIYFW